VDRTKLVAIPAHNPGGSHPVGCEVRERHHEHLTLNPDWKADHNQKGSYEKILCVHRHASGIKTPEVKKIHTCPCCGWQGEGIAAHSIWACPADPTNTINPIE